MNRNSTARKPKPILENEADIADEQAEYDRLIVAAAAQ